MTVDHQMDYSFAGKGAKRRARQAVEPQRKPKQRPYLRKPEAETRRAKRLDMSDTYQHAQGVKARIRLLVIDHDMSFIDCMQTLKDQGYGVSGVAVGNVRREMCEVMKLLESEGLINVEALERRRRKIKRRDRDTM